MKKQILLLTSVIILGILNLSAQNYQCGTDQVVLQSFQNNPQYEATFNEMAEFARKYTKESYNPNEKGVVYQIPIVFHVIHNYGSENISRNTILNALDVMNARWRKTNPDSIFIVAPFNQIHKDMEIEFVLAKKDINGNCINGVTRLVSDQTYSGSDAVKSLTDQVLDFPHNRYLNIWVVRTIASGAGGYSYFPGTTSNSSDGIVVRSDQLSALAHEAGHWLNLPHPWGLTNNNNVSSNCNSDDSVDDTPNTMGQSNCNTSRNSCSNNTPIPFLDINGAIIWPSSNGEIHDNVQNVMDYAFCAPENFTEGQKAKTRAALTSATAQRNNLITSSNHTATGINGGFTCSPAPVVDFDIEYEYVCTDNSYEQYMRNNTYNSDNITYNWTFEAGTSSNATSKNATASYATPGIYDVTLDATSAGGTTSRTKTDLVKIISGVPTTPFIESFGSATFPVNNASDFKNDWFVDGLGSSNTFVRSDVTGHNSLSSAKLNIKTAPGTHRLISPLFDLAQSNCDSLTFYLAYTKRNTNSSDKLKVYASRSCGRTWPTTDKIVELSASQMETAPPIISSNFTPTADEWQKFSFSISKYAGDEIIFMFEVETGNGNTLYLDDINIGCSQKIVVTDAIDENIGVSFNIFPNPTSSDANLTINTTEAINHIIISDVTGKVLASKNINSTGKMIQTTISEVVGRNLTNGIYLVTVGNSNNSKTQKLIIN